MDHTTYMRKSDALQRLHLRKAFIDHGYSTITASCYASLLKRVSKLLGFINVEVIYKQPTKTWLDYNKFTKILSTFTFHNVYMTLTALLAWLIINDETDTEIYHRASFQKFELRAYTKRINEGRLNSGEEKKIIHSQSICEIYNDILRPFFIENGFIGNTQIIPDYTKYTPKELTLIEDYVLLAIYIYPFINLYKNILAETFPVLTNQVANLRFSPRLKPKSEELIPDECYYVEFTPQRSDYNSLNRARIFLPLKEGSVTYTVPPVLAQTISRWCKFKKLSLHDRLFTRKPTTISPMINRYTSKLIPLCTGIPLQLLHKMYLIALKPESIEV